MPTAARCAISAEAISDSAARPASVGATLASCVTALVANVVYGQALGVITWDQANLAVVPMTAGVLIALVWRGRAAQAIGPALIAGAWIVYFTALQGALK